ncbi:MAG TPA: hypothetical protein VNK43_09080 [Gemmatimonadales bacterium]|nr:hypothetical protein [Gemmatimonadales bacterium]
MRTTSPGNERGIALAIAVFALVVIGALVTGAFYAGRLEQRAGDHALYQAQALGAAEAGTDQVLGNWNIGWNATAPGDSVLIGTTSLGGGSAYSALIRRLNSSLFLIQATGEYRGPGGSILSRRMVASLSRIITPDIEIEAALTVRGSLRIGGSAHIDGNDHGNGWPGCPANQNMAGIRSDQPQSSIQTNGSNCNNLNCVYGTPRFVQDTTINANTFTQFGSTDFWQLASAADKVISGTVNGLAPVVSSGTCDRSVATNWGEPNWPVTTTAPCSNYFPIIYAPGNVRINGGRGQGILLVAGDLDLSGGVEFYGPVIVLGNVTSTGTGGHVYGGLMASNADLNPSTILGNSVVNFSSCAVYRALQGVSTVEPLRERSWAQLY